MFRSPVHAGAALVATLFGAILLCASGCARKTSAHAPPPPAPARIGDTETGIASWYGAPYHGRRAASGEVYDMEQLTAAHRTLPFNTWVEVKNQDNGKQVDVRITDRGPFVGGRIIDLSLAAAREIDMVAQGTARVKLRVVPAPHSAAAAVHPQPPPVGQYAVQAGAFSDRSRADRLADSLRDQFTNVRVVAAPRVWRVLVGHETALESANELATKVRAAVGEAVVVEDR